MNEDDFYLKVAHALSGCQLVEQELKLYLTEAFELARKCIGKRMPFHLTGDDYADSSLEGLIKMFKKVSDNAALVAELNHFKQRRNFLSHKAIAHCLDYEGELLHSVASEFQEQLTEIQSEAHRLRAAIHEEANKFQVHLWFDDIRSED
jgi:hypothetical protein